jgi:magnesium chelatase family protein
MLVAAANPCKCGYLSDPARACSRAPVCGEDYMGRISGPLMDRFDLRVDVPPVAFRDLDLPSAGTKSKDIAARVAAAREVQTQRFRDHPQMSQNADLEGDILDRVTALEDDARNLITQAADRFGLSARGYHRVLRVARSIADLAESAPVTRDHVAEALSYRLPNSAT